MMTELQKFFIIILPQDEYYNHGCLKNVAIEDII